MSQRNKIPIVILNWNNFKDTKECMDSVLAYESGIFHIFLLDNFSNQLERDLLIKTYSNHPQVSITLNSINLGFAKAHNLIFKEIVDQYPYIFVLNNDTFLPKKTLELIEKFNMKDDVGMISFKMISYWDHEIMDNAGHKMLSSGEIIPIGHGNSVNDYKHSFENMGSCAGATLYNSKLLKEIGLFDDYFNTGYEDAELGLRAIIAGYKSVYNPQFTVYHKMGQSIKKVFNYNYTLKIQCDIYYTYLKLVHWQVILIHLIPFVLRFLLITLIDIVFWRPKYLKIQYHALYIILFKDIRKVIKARKDAKSLKRISWYNLLKRQEFFLLRDINNFYKFIIKGEKSYFEK